MMAAEAERALQDDSNAIGWYDRKLKAAKSVLALVEPRIFNNADNEAALILLWQLLRTVLQSRITLQTPSRCSALSRDWAYAGRHLEERRGTQPGNG